MPTRTLRRLTRQVRNQKEHDLSKPVPLPVDFASVSPHERDVARFQAEDARTGAQTDEDAPTVRRKRGLRNVKLRRKQ